MKPLDVLRGVWSDESGLGVRERAVLTALIMRADERGRCWPSLSRLAADAGLARSTAAEALNELVRAGWVRRIPRPLPETTLYIVREPDSPGAGRSEDRNEIVREPDADSPGAGHELPIELPIELPNTDTAKTLWSVWLEELGGSGRRPSLTEKRRKVLEALHREQLAGEPDPLEAFRAICRAVKASPHHMETRAYQLPESLFRNPERRERWALDGAAANGKGATTPSPAPQPTRRSGYRDPAAGIDWSTYDEEDNHGP